MSHTLEVATKNFSPMLGKAKETWSTFSATWSQVFGWLTLDKNRWEYVGSGTNEQGRKDLIAWARQAAFESGVDLSLFFSVVISMNVPTDLYGGATGAVCDDGRWDDGTSSISPSLTGQEMGHVYGLNHSRVDGSSEDYKDAWDVMSTASTPFMAPHPNFTELDKRANPVFRMGPGLNAANMWSQDCLDLTRVWTADTEYNGIVQLRPLHRLDLPGYLVARIGRWFFEFRMPELWDAAISHAVILVHDFVFGNSYIYAGTKGNQGLTSGDQFQAGDPSDALGAFLRVTVSNIDATNRVATLSVLRKPNRHPKSGPELVLEGVASDGGGWVAIGGRIKKIPPWSPLYAMVEAIAQIQEIDSTNSGIARNLVQASAFERIAQLTGAQLGRLQSFRSPALPATMEGNLKTTSRASRPKRSSKSRPT